MGLKDKLKQRTQSILAKEKNFEPIELTEGNVNAIYNRCHTHPKEGDSKDDFYMSLPFPKSMGYSDIYNMQYFNKQALDKNKANILYLLGQIKGISDKTKISIPDFSYTYNDKIWVSDPNVLMHLFYLTTAYGADILSNFDNRDKSNSTRILHAIEPTLSPKDPNFKEWYKGYAKRHPELNIELDGQEPADM